VVRKKDVGAEIGRFLKKINNGLAYRSVL